MPIWRLFDKARRVLHGRKAPCFLHPIQVCRQAIETARKLVPLSTFMVKTGNFLIARAVDMGASDYMVLSFRSEIPVAQGARRFLIRIAGAGSQWLRLRSGHLSAASAKI